MKNNKFLGIEDLQADIAESEEAWDSAENIYVGTCILLLFIGFMTIGFDDILGTLTVIFAYLGLRYFFNMWKNISLNTSVANKISLLYLEKSGLLEEE